MNAIDPGRPEGAEFSSNYGAYIGLVPENDIVAVLARQLDESMEFLRGIREADAEVLHAPYTWTAKQVVGHVLDGERIFGLRAFCFSRNDPNPLPGFDENAYVREAHFNRRTLRDLVDEFELVRRANLSFFRHLEPSAWLRSGVANNHKVSVRALSYVLAGHARHHLDILRKRFKTLSHG